MGNYVMKYSKFIIKIFQQKLCLYIIYPILMKYVFRFCRIYLIISIYLNTEDVTFFNWNKSNNLRKTYVGCNIICIENSMTTTNTTSTLMSPVAKHTVIAPANFLYHIWPYRSVLNYIHYNRTKQGHTIPKKCINI